MALSLPPADDEDDVVSQINTTPLVDVMLVLLIIFLITVPVVTASIPVELPKERNALRETKPENVTISVDANGGIWWNDLRVANGAALIERLKTVAAKDPQPEVHVRGDAAADYDGVGRVIHALQRAGIARVSFLTEPPARGFPWRSTCRPRRRAASRRRCSRSTRRR